MVWTEDVKMFLVSLAVTLVAALILYLIRPKANVIWGQLHGFAFNVPDQSQPTLALALTTQAYFIENAGRGIAEKIQIIFNYKPHHFEVWPVVPYTTTINPDNRFIIHVDHLGAREFTNVHVLDANPPELLRVRAKDREATLVATRPQRVVSKWVIVLVAVFMIIGVSTIVYGVIKAAQILLAT